MKKLFFIVLFGIMALFMTKVYAEESIPLYEEFNNELIKFENSVGWRSRLFSPYLVNGKMFLDVSYGYCTGYTEDNESCTGSFGESFLSSIDNLDNRGERSLSVESVIDNYFYNYGIESSKGDEYVYTINKYDENFNQVGQVTFKTKNRYSGKSTFIKNVNNELVFIDLEDLYIKEIALYKEQHGYDVYPYERVCNYAVIDNEFTSATEKPCDDTLVPEVLKNYIIQNGKTIKSDDYDTFGDKVVFIDGKKLYYYENNKLVFEKNAETENAHFFKVRFLDKYIVVAEDHTHFGEICEDIVLPVYEDCVHYSKLLFYDEDGNLVKTIDDNNNIYDFNVDREYNKLVMTNVDYDGVCAVSSYAWVEACVPTLRYSMYVYEPEPEKTPDKPNEVISDEPNPNTNDIVIIIATVLCISIILLSNSQHHKKELED